jgi:hypothetical protein
MKRAEKPGRGTERIGDAFCRRGEYPRLLEMVRSRDSEGVEDLQRRLQREPCSLK